VFPIGALTQGWKAHSWVIWWHWRDAGCIAVNTTNHRHPRQDNFKVLSRALEYAATHESVGGVSSWMNRSSFWRRFAHEGLDVGPCIAFLAGIPERKRQTYWRDAWLLTGRKDRERARAFLLGWSCASRLKWSRMPKASGLDLWPPMLPLHNLLLNDSGMRSGSDGFFGGSLSMCVTVAWAIEDRLTSILRNKSGCYYRDLFWSSAFHEKKMAKIAPFAGHWAWLWRMSKFLLAFGYAINGGLKET